jgi:hypothetical protein
MSERTAWDLTSANSLAGAARWVRKQSGALLVLVIRRRDAAIATEPGMAPMKAIDLIRNELPQLLEYLIKQQGVRTGNNPDAEDPS